MRRLLFALPLVCACAVDLTIPPTATVNCDTDADCPSNYACDEAAKLCFDTRTGLTTPPKVFLEPIARTTGDVTVALTVSDNEQDDATLSMEFDIGNGMQPATIEPTLVRATRAGERHLVVWHAAADIGDSAFRDDVMLRVSASDSSGSGTTVGAAPFSFGDDLPEITGFGVEGTGALAGNVLVTFTVADRAHDLMTLARLEVSYDGTFAESVVIYDADAAPNRDALPSGSVSNIESDEVGVVQRLAWSSALTSVVDAPQARLRLVLRDAFGVSEPAVSAPFHLRNQVPARISNLRAPKAGRRAAGPVHFIYRLTDENGDPADVRFEYALDGGDGFLPCREYRVPESEGLTALAATPLATGGVEHVFVWDAASVPSSTFGGVVRARTSDPEDRGELVAFGAGIGPPSHVLYDRTSVSSPGTTRFVAADFNGDGFVDIANAVGATEGLALGCIPAPCFGSLTSFAPPSAGNVNGMVAADFTGDGGVDLVTARDGTPRLLLRASTAVGAGAFALSASTSVVASLGSAPLDATTGDFDGDTHPDIAVLLATAVVTYYGDGVGGFGSPATTPLEATHSFAKARINRDAADDVWVLLAAGATDTLAALSSVGSRAPFAVETSGDLGDANLFAAADFDTDGLTDVVLSSTNRSNADLFLALSGGALVAGGSVPLSIGSLQALASGDVNGDARPDIVYDDRFTTTGTVAVRINAGVDDDGAVHFAEAAVGMTAISNRIGLIDLNGDGADDAIATDDFSSSGLFIGTTASGYGIRAGTMSEEPLQLWNGTAWYQWFAMADFNGDGNRDLAFVDDVNDTVELWLGEGTRGLSDAAWVGPAVAIQCVSCAGLAAGDVDGDANADLWFTASGAGMFARGRGDATFDAPVSMPVKPPTVVGIDPLGIFQPLPVADFDGDGVLDSVRDGGTTLGVFRGLDAGVAGPTVPESFNSTAAATVAPLLLDGYNYAFVADIDTDGLVDVITSSRQSSSRLYFTFGQRDVTTIREVSIDPFVATPLRGGRVAASAFAPDLVGETITAHPSHAGLFEPVTNWERDLVGAGLLSAAAPSDVVDAGASALPFTAPYQLFGDIRLSARGSGPALTSESRLGDGTPLDVTTASRGVIVDMPVSSSFSALQVDAALAVGSANVRVFVRTTTYDDLAAGTPRRSHAWTTIPRDSDGDLSTGSGQRFVVTKARDGRALVRVLLQRFGVVQAFFQ